MRFSAAAEPAARQRVRLVFTVTDSGIGITRRRIKTAVPPFAQASAEVARRYGGAGLGLVFVKRIAKAMGGDLTVTSKPGRGSTFRLTVLVEAVAATTGDDARGARQAPARRAASLLCAEDNPYGRVVINTILSELGHRVDFVGSGEAAVEAAARGGYDAVLMDVTLPGIDGLEATRRIRALPRRRRPHAGDRRFRPREQRDEEARARRRHECLSAQAGQPGEVEQRSAAFVAAGLGEIAADRSVCHECEDRTRTSGAVASTRPRCSRRRSTIRTRSAMMRFSSKSFGV